MTSSRRPVSALCAALCAAALLPAVAHADDPLLSGYAGPGGGEQAILGGGLQNGSGGSGSSGASGSGSGAAAPAATTPQVTPTPASTSTQSSSTSSSKGKGDGKASSSKRDGRSSYRSPKTTSTPSSTTPSIQADQQRAAQAFDRGDGASPLISAGTIAALAGVLVLLGLFAVGMRRLQRADDRR